MHFQSAEYSITLKPSWDLQNSVIVLPYSSISKAEVMQLVIISLSALRASAGCVVSISHDHSLRKSYFRKSYQGRKMTGVNTLKQQ